MNKSANHTHRYADAVTWDGKDTSVADMRKISAIEPEALTPANPGHAA